MGRDDLGPIAQYNSLTDPYLQGYWSKSMIRHHLRQTGLISRKGDIVPEEVWRKRISTKQKMDQASQLIASKIVQQAIELKNLERAEIRRKLDEVAKKELVRRIRGQSVQNRELPLLWPRQRSPRTHSANEYEINITLGENSEGNFQASEGHFQTRPDRHSQYRRTGKKTGNKLGSQKRLTKLNRGYTVLPRQEPTPVMVTMYYYGKSVNIPFDTQVFEYRDEIAIYQQHCGGENLLVYSGLHQAGDKFEFRSKRHKEFPFSLTIYINGTYDCRISTCCEYKHQLNVKIGGKGGRFAITNVTGSQPCIKCLLEKSEQDAKRQKEREEKRRMEENNYDDVEVQALQPVATHKSSGSQEPTEVQVQHEKEEEEGHYDNEFDDSDGKDDHKNNEEEEEEVHSRAHSVRSVRSVEETPAIIQVRHHPESESDPSSIESDRKSPEQKRKSPEQKRKASTDSVKEEKVEPKRYSSNDVIDIIENKVDSFRSSGSHSARSSKKSTPRDNTSEDESKQFELKKPSSVKGSKSSSRASNKSPSKKSDSDSDQPAKVRTLSRANDSENDSDTDKLLKRIDSGRKSQSPKASKSVTPVEKAKTPSRKSSDSARSKSPSLKSPSPLERSKSKTPSKASSPVDTRDDTKSPSVKGSKPPSPTKSASKSPSPVQEKVSSRKSSAKSKHESDSEKEQPAKSSKPPSPTKSPNQPKSKSPAEKQINNILSSTDDDSKETSSLFSSMNNSLNNAKGEVSILEAIPSENVDEKTNNLDDNTNTNNNASSSSSSKSGSKNSSPLPDVRTSVNDESPDSSKKVTDRPPSSRKSSRPPSQKSNKSEVERPSSQKSNKSDTERPSSQKSIKSDQKVPQVNVIPSSDVEKNSSTSLNDDTKWYKDEDLNH